MAKIPKITSRVGKYFVAVNNQGKTKKEAQIIAGYSLDNQSSKIEATKGYKALQARFANTFLSDMPLKELSGHLIDNIRQKGQNRIDRNARNGAIKIALDKIEPETGKPNSLTNVLVILGD